MRPVATARRRGVMRGFRSEAVADECVITGHVRWVVGVIAYPAKGAT